MKKTLFFSFLLLFLPVVVNAQSDRDAYKALKKLQLTTKMVINYKEYRDAFVDTKVEVDMFIETATASANQAFVNHMKKALKAYEVATKIWTEELRQKERNNSLLAGQGSLRELMNLSSESIGKNELQLYLKDFPAIDNPKLKDKDGEVLRQLAIGFLWTEASKEVELAHNKLIEQSK